MKNKEKLMRTIPMLREETLQCHDQALPHQELMSVSSTLKKSLYAFLVMVISAACIWYNFHSLLKLNYRSRGKINVYSLFLLLNFLPYMVWDKPLLTKYVIFPYAIVQGCVIGYFIKAVHKSCPDVLLIAFLVFLVVVLMDIGNIIKVDNKMSMRITFGLYGLLFLLLTKFYLFLLGYNNKLGFIYLIFDNSWIGIVVCVCIMVLVYVCLQSNIAIVKQSAKNKYAKAMEWYCALALLTTLQWMIYLELTRFVRTYISKRYREIYG